MLFTPARSGSPAASCGASVVTPPKGLVELGWGAVALFFFVLAIFYIFKIVQAVKGSGNGKRMPCVQSPQFQAIITNQALQLSALGRVEVDGSALRENMVLQTQLMKQTARVLEELSKCAVRQETRDR